MELMCITDASKQFKVSSKTLRYYENVGILKPVRVEGSKYRYYDNDAVERIRQILILRKMQITIKDIIRIYDSRDMSTVVEVFVDRINAIDEQVGALSELKLIINEFLQTMLKNGITKISALPLLYEEMDRQLTVLEKRKPFTEKDLTAVSEKLARPLEISIVDLPPMRVLTSFLKPDTTKSDFSGFSRYTQTNGLSRAAPGNHRQFEFQTEAGDVRMVRIPDDFVNDSRYLDYIFEGGLFAAANVYLDEDLGQYFRILVGQLDTNPYYQFAYCTDGTSRHPALLENLISPDDKRELVSLLVPVSRRMADPARFDKPKDVTDLTIAEIEEANPVLWTVDVPMDGLISIHSPYYRITGQGEAEYIAWISTRVLSTGISVRLPFRVDVEFRIQKESMQFAWGTDEGSIRLYQGGDLNYLFGINMETNPDKRLSQEAICFHQPIFRDYFRYPNRGRIRENEYNRLTWIVGEKHLAVIINDEIRFCGEDFPYMAADLMNQNALPIMVGSNGQSKIFFRSIRVSQLAQAQKSRIKEGELTMVTRQSNNCIPNIHRFIISEHGENYHFNGCARYVMECLGEYTVDSDLMTEEIYNCKKAVTDLGYWFFAGLTGDVLAQVYSYKGYMGEAVSACMFNSEGGRYFERIFERCGYASTFVSGKQLAANREMYMQTLMAYIDKGIPIIAITHNGPSWGIYVGYEEFGKTLLYLASDRSEPERIAIDKAIGNGVDLTDFHDIQQTDSFHQARGWIFVGEKKTPVDVAQIYRDIIYDIPKLFAVKTDAYCFGAEAFRAWADGIENGKFDHVKPEDFDGWDAHVSNICNMATNGSCAHNFLKRAQGLNPDMTFLDDVNRLYERIAEIWNHDNGEDLEALGGGFNVTLDLLQDPKRRGKIAKKIREAADAMDEVVRIINENLKKTKS